MYGSIAAHSRAGLNVAARRRPSRRRGPGRLRTSARRPARRPRRRSLSHRRDHGTTTKVRPGSYATGSDDEPVPDAVRRWQHEVHVPGIYDLEVDTSLLTPEQCARHEQAVARDRRRPDRLPHASGLRAIRGLDLAVAGLARAFVICQACVKRPADRECAALHDWPRREIYAGTDGHLQFQRRRH
jgi:chloramphenicol 3-O phosphotransferase